VPRLDPVERAFATVGFDIVDANDTAPNQIHTVDRIAGPEKVRAGRHVEAGRATGLETDMYAKAHDPFFLVGGFVFVIEAREVFLRDAFRESAVGLVVGVDEKFHLLHGLAPHQCAATCAVLFDAQATAWFCNKCYGAGGLGAPQAQRPAAARSANQRTSPRALIWEAGKLSSPDRILSRTSRLPLPEIRKATISLALIAG